MSIVAESFIHKVEIIDPDSGSDPYGSSRRVTGLSIASGSVYPCRLRRNTRPVESDRAEGFRSIATYRIAVSPNVSVSTSHSILRVTNRLDAQLWGQMRIEGTVKFETHIDIYANEVDA